MTEGLGRRWSVVGPFETVDLNTRGGIAEHARRMGPAYARMGRERGQDDPWTAELVAEVAEARRAALAMDRWDERVRWRDRLMLALERCRRGIWSTVTIAPRSILRFNRRLSDVASYSVSADERPN